MTPTPKLTAAISEILKAAKNAKCGTITMGHDGGAKSFWQESLPPGCIIAWDDASISALGESVAAFPESSKAKAIYITASANNAENLALALKETLTALEFIRSGCLVPPDGGSPSLSDAVASADIAIANAERLFENE